MAARGVPTDFRFWNQRAGFDIDQHLIAYSAASTYGRAFFVGLLNTALVAAIGVVFATLLGFALGFARLSANVVLAKFAIAYVETLRNVPLLLQLLFWYNVALRVLPAPRFAISLPGDIYLTNRGVALPEPVFAQNALFVLAAALAGIAAAFLFWRWAKTSTSVIGRGRLRSLILILLICAPPVAIYFALGEPIGWIAPQLKGFNFYGGWRILPELAALLLGLVLYTAAFIAEIVRAGIEAVAKGQSEAAQALGLSPAQTRRYVIVPQAMRLIVPPLTSQYLNLIKNSSLAVFIGYPDLVQVFAGTVLNQTGAAVPIIMTTMAVYLAISLATSLAMNSYNRHIARAER
jgi:general L-amino acid transport system permease protein